MAVECASQYDIHTLTRTGHKCAQELQQKIISENCNILDIKVDN